MRRQWGYSTWEAEASLNARRGDNRASDGSMVVRTATSNPGNQFNDDGNDVGLETILKKK